MTRTLVLLGVLALGSGCGVYGLKTNASEQVQLAPEFALPDADGSIVSLDDLLAGGSPAVLVFYRGHW